MLYGMYVSAGGAMASSYRQDVVANNLANVDTVAFKRDLALLEARRTQTQQAGSSRYSTALLEGIGGGTFALPTHTDFTPASLKQTGSSFDVALTEKGFFQVSDGSRTNYSRDGRFKLDQQNQLVTVAGSLPVLSDAGTAITVNPDTEFDIDATGLIVQGETPVARLGIVDFSDTSKLRKEGDNLYSAPSNLQAKHVDCLVKQGYLEESSVDPIGELTEMIKSSRAFQTNLSMLKLQDETLGLAVTRLGNIT